MKQETKIACPNCDFEIDINNIIAGKLEEEYKKKYNAMWVEEKQKQKNELDKIESQRNELILEKEKQAVLIAQKIKDQLNKERGEVEKQIKSKVDEEQSEWRKSMEKEMGEKSEQLKDFHRLQAENARIIREKDELKESIEADAQKRLNQQIIEEKEKIRKSEQDKNELLLKELKKQLEDQKKLTEEMKRKQEQGSMQLQGEVQELAIEEWLLNNFPLDTITEIKKGDRGADCIQTVHTRTRQNCGDIYYESKRTKDFNNNWIEKFKNDIRDKGANIGVLVTDTYPKGMERMDLIDGVWVCSFEEFKGLCIVLREGIVQLNALTSSQENKGEKMIMLYDFLISNEFRLQIEGIVEGFTQMQIDLETEKRSIIGHWKKREKQIQKVLINTNHMYNSIKGIAGSAILPIQALELPDVSEDNIEALE